MPFTPFHFGPGLFGKSIIPRHFSWLAFVASQVVIDCETLFFLLQGAYPVHRFLHTFAGATIAGVATGLGFVAVRKICPRALPAQATDHRSLASESSTLGVMVGAVLGGISHPFLDGIMHRDVRPFAPWADTNPLLGLVGLGALHLGCAVLGLIGLIVTAARVHRERR